MKAPTDKFKAINSILSKAREGASFAFLSPWYYWLAEPDFTTALPHQKRPDGTDRMGTEAPVSSISDAFFGKTVDELATALKDAPQEAYLNREYFAVVDEQSQQDRTVMLCRVTKEGEVLRVRTKVEESAQLLAGMTVAKPYWADVFEDGP